MDRLQRLLDGFKHSPPTAFVMMGNFSDAPRDANSYRELRKHFAVSRGRPALHTGARGGGGLVVACAVSLRELNDKHHL